MHALFRAASCVVCVSSLCAVRHNHARLCALASPADGNGDTIRFAHWRRVAQTTRCHRHTYNPCVSHPGNCGRTLHLFVKRNSHVGLNSVLPSQQIGSSIACERSEIIRNDQGEVSNLPSYT